MSRTLVKAALNATAPADTIFLQGWVRTRRDAKAFSFIELNDGSCLKGLQIIIDATLPDYAQVARAGTGASVEVHGKLVASKGGGQKWEVVAEKFTVLGEADATYPLKERAHLRISSRNCPPPAAIQSLRRRLSCAQSFSLCRAPILSGQRVLLRPHPIITASDAEGAGDMFRVTTLDLATPPKNEQGEIDHRQDFLGKKPS